MSGRPLVSTSRKSSLQKCSLGRVGAGESLLRLEGRTRRARDNMELRHTEGVVQRAASSSSSLSEGGHGHHGSSKAKSVAAGGCGLKVKSAVTSAIASFDQNHQTAGASVPKDMSFVGDIGGACGVEGQGEERAESCSLRVRQVPDFRSCWIEVSSKFEPIRLRITNDGIFELWRKDEENRESLCCRGSVTLPGDLDVHQFSYSLPRGQDAKNCDSVTIWWADRVSVVISPSEEEGDGEPNKWCRGLRSGFVLKNYVSCEETDMAEVKIEMESAGKWFGGAHFMNQIWPLNKVSWEMGPFYPFDHGPTGLNTLVAPQWMTSNGLLVMVNPDTPCLHVGMNGPEQRRTFRKWGTGVQNATKSILPMETSEFGVATEFDGMLRLQARRDYVDEHVYHTWNEWKPSAEGGGGEGEGRSEQQGDRVGISIALCAFPDILESSLASFRTLPKPDKAPALHILKDPIWTTWAKYKQWVTEGKVLKYANEIKDSGLDFSVMEIDDRWQIRYGDLDFDPAKFPDPKGMVSKLHDMGFKVTLWVMPFIEKRSAAYREGIEKDYFVKKVSSPSHPYEEKPGFFSWWNFPSVVALDVTNPEAVEWYVSRLRRLQDLYGIDGFKFDAGEPCFLPRDPITRKPLSYPSEYTHLWVKEVASKFQGGVSEVRTGHKTQDVGMMTRIGDRFSTWDIRNGLQSIIPTVLTSGLLGYPFALPDIIGGNAYFGRNPDTELFVRWTQVNALMPAMQFSIAPWHIGQEAQALVSQAMQVRKKLMGEILKLAEDAAETLRPIVRPMWWISNDPEAFDIADQFCLGDDIIVAPVVVKGDVSKRLYLPCHESTWVDVDSGETFQGGQWVTTPAPLNKLPVFIRKL